MAFQFYDTDIPGLKIIEPHMYPDERGLYKKYYEKDIFAENGIIDIFHEASDLYTIKGALRGLHYQTKEPQAKLIHVIKGKIYDVALDLREKSPSFGKYRAEILDEDHQIIKYIPVGFAHGFIALTDQTVFSYQCSGKYLPSECSGIRWDDPTLNIPWPLKEYGIHQVIATEKDKNLPTFEEYKRGLGL